MANRERGEVSLHTGMGEYTLRLTTNACCEVEERSGKTYEEHRALWNKGNSVTSFRWLVWVALQDHHGEAFKTPESVGPVIDACDPKDIVRVMVGFCDMNQDEIKRLIKQGLLSAVKTATSKPGPGEPHPPKAQESAGGVSTSTPVGSA